MDPEPSRATYNFEFAFNSSSFSDRVLRIEIMAEPPDAGSSHRKRKRDDGTKEKALKSTKCTWELTLNCEHETHDCEENENHTEHDELGLHELTPSALQAVVDSENDSSIRSSPYILRVKSMPINSAILAAKSPFFYKFFSNGMKESEQQHPLLRINQSEEAAFMELLSFMYSEKLSVTSPTLILDVLMAADKFEVVSCMEYCSKLLRSLPWTTESALLCLDLPCSISLASAVRPLIVDAKDFLVNSYKDVANFEDEMMNLPLAAIEAILSSDDLQLTSEDALYDFVLKWARTQYTALDERRDILSSRLIHRIRFAYLSCSKLRGILMCADLDHDVASKLVIESLFFMCLPSFKRLALAANKLNHRRFVERAYKCCRLKEIEFCRPHPQCIVYWDLTREKCAELFPSGHLYSNVFHFCGQNFYLTVQCHFDEQSSFHWFGLSLSTSGRGSQSRISRTVDYEVAARDKQLAGEFAIQKTGRHTFTGSISFTNLIVTKWSAFIAEDCRHFVEGTLYLRVEVTIKPPQPPPQQ